jgi:hypothetical protein
MARKDFISHHNGMFAIASRSFFGYNIMKAAGVLWPCCFLST